MDLERLSACALLTWCCLSALHVHTAESKLVGAAVIPHGDFAYDPSVVNFTNGSRTLHKESLFAGHYVMETLQPDVVVLTTPHGIELSDELVIYESSTESGAAPVGDDIPHHSVYEVNMTLRTDVELAKAVREHLQSRHLPATGIQAFSDRFPLPVSWGEILPMSYLNSSLAAGQELPPVILVGIPYKRFNHSTEMAADLLKAGSAMGEFLDATERRVVWLVSADLAHTHQASGPYGFCPCAKLFDDAAGDWLRTLDSAALLDRATVQQKAGAAACGYTGLVMLEGAINATQRSSWSSRLEAIAAPTYYGMAVATMQRHQPHIMPMIV